MREKEFLACVRGTKFDRGQAKKTEEKSVKDKGFYFYFEGTKMISLL